MNTKVVFCHAGAKSFKSHRLPPPVTLRSNKTRITIEKYYICNRIERVKQLLLFEDLSLKEIARKMRYSRPSHLFNQFKKIAGSTPS